jgi:hypothetical protein
MYFIGSPSAEHPCGASAETSAPRPRTGHSSWHAPGSSLVEQLTEQVEGGHGDGLGGGHGRSDQVKNGTLKTYPGYPHGMPTTHADVINPDLLAFIRS